MAGVLSEMPPEEFVVSLEADEADDCRFVITLINYFSKWAEVFLTSRVTSQNVIFFLRAVFSRDGFPDVLVSDTGPQFDSREFGYF